MRLAVVTYRFHPEPCAPSARLYSLCRRAVLRGHEVTVLTAGSGAGAWLSEQRMAGFLVLRLRRRLGGPCESGAGFFLRALGHLEFFLGAMALAIKGLGQADVFVASSPSCSAVAVAWVLSALRGAMLVIDSRGPGLKTCEAVEETPSPPRMVSPLAAAAKRLSSVLLRSSATVLRSLEAAIYLRASAVAVTTESLKERLLSLGVPERKVAVLPDAAELLEFQPGPRDESLIKALGAQGRFVVLYAGSVDPAAGLGVVLEAAKALSVVPDVLFVIAGEGQSRAGLMERARTMGLKNTVFVKAQGRDRMPLFYNSADICLVPMSGEAELKAVLPCKIFEILACGKPIAASASGEAAHRVRVSGAGIVCDPGDAASLTKAILRLKSDAALSKEMSAAAREFAVQNHDAAVFAEKYLALLEGLQQP